MSYFFKGLFYRLLIDPLLASVRKSVLDSIDPSSNVIDIACGTGTMAIEIGRKVKHVVAIDLDSGMIEYAGSRARRKNLDNIRFENRDASDLSIYSDKEFNVAVTSMSIHQFEAELAVRILSEMRRIASTVIIVDYFHPLPANPAGQIAGAIEKMAGGDHYQNFNKYIGSGGLNYFTERAGIKISSEERRGFGVFVVALGKEAVIR